MNGFIQKEFKTTFFIISFLLLTTLLSSFALAQCPTQTLPKQGVNPPKDLDGDGYCEDVNGDGVFNTTDGVVLALNIDSDVVQNNVISFDFNLNDRIDFDDAAQLNFYAEDQCYTFPPCVQVDFVVTELKTEPENPTTDDEVYIIATVKNTGSGDYDGSIAASIYIKVDDGSWFSGTWWLPTISSGGSKDVKTTKSVKWSAGTHEITAIADNNKKIKETDEDNNKKTGEFTVGSVSKPDLRILGVSTSKGTFEVNEHLDYVNAEIKNIGTVASGSFKVKLEASESAGDKTCYKDVSGLSPGTQTTVTFYKSDCDIYYPSTGSKSIKITADSDNTIDESNENNNYGTLTITVTCTPKTCSDLGKECGSWDDGCGNTIDCGSCPSGETCNSEGKCVSTCTSHDHKACYNNKVYWYDSCDKREEIYENCSAQGKTCQNGQCVTISCDSDSDCGSITYGPWSSCSYPSTCSESGTKTREKHIPKCENPGTPSSSCKTITETETGTCTRDTDGNTCDTNKVCSNGQCVAKPDLDIVSFSYSPSGLKVNEHIISMNINVKNRGSSSSGSFKVKLESSESAGDKTCYKDVTDIDSGLSKYVYFSQSECDIYYTSSGTKTIKVTADSDNTIDEINETNNVWIQNITVGKAEKCIDTDGGKNYTVRGNVKKGDKSFGDTCLSDSELKEYYCQNNEVKSETVTCDNGCYQGHGICQSDGRDPPCDEYGDVDDDGKVTNVDSVIATRIVTGLEDGTPEQKRRIDVDGDGSLTGDDPINIIKYERGEINTFPVCEITCKDSDSGKNYTAQGTVTVGSDKYTDTCMDNSKLKEYYCEGNSVKSETINCDYGCGLFKGHDMGMCKTKGRDPPCDSYGDVDKDGKVRNADAIIAFVAVIEGGISLTSDEKERADVDNKNGLNLRDSFLIYKYERGEINTFAACGCPSDPVTGTKPSQDLDNDGLCEDVNGDGKFMFNDAVDLALNIDSDVVQNNVISFDFNRNQRADFDDATKLARMAGKQYLISSDKSWEEIKGNCELRYDQKGLWLYDPPEYGAWKIIGKTEKMDPGRGYWVVTKEMCSMDIPPNKPSGKMKLHEGWNMISSPYSWNQIKGTCTLVKYRDKYIYYWEGDTQKFRTIGPDTKMDSTKGYYVSVKNNCEIDFDVEKGCPSDPIVGTKPSQDLDGDSYCEDVNGDGVLTFADVVALALNIDEDIVILNYKVFDFNQNDRADFDDAVSLAIKRLQSKALSQDVINKGAEKDPLVIGDVNGDGALGPEDAVTIAFIASENREKPKVLCHLDVNKNARIDFDDAVQAYKSVGRDKPFGTCTAKPPCEEYGDIDGDGLITYDDAVTGARMIEEPTERMKKWGEVNNNGRLDFDDYVQIGRYSYGLVNNFAVCTKEPTPSLEFNVNPSETTSIPVSASLNLEILNQGSRKVNKIEIFFDRDPEITPGTGVWILEKDINKLLGGMESVYYHLPGKHNLKATVYFDDGISISDNATIELIQNDPPEPEAEIPATSSIGKSNSFSAESSMDTDGTITNYRWDFGDGETAEGATATHEYTKEGNYVVSVSVTDDSGDTTVFMKEISVGGPKPKEIEEHELFNLNYGWNTVYFNVKDVNSGVIFSHCENPLIIGLNEDQKLYKVTSGEEIRGGEGYLVRINNKCKLTSVMETYPTDKLVLKEGWNFVGYSEDVFVDELKEECGTSTLVIGLNLEQKLYKEGVVIKGKEGYLIRVPKDCTFLI